MRGDIDFIREQNKLKTAIPLGQVMDYGILKEVLAEMKRLRLQKIFLIQNKPEIAVETVRRI